MRAVRVTLGALAIAVLVSAVPARDRSSAAGTGGWGAGGEMTEARSDQAAAALPDGRILIVGGSNKDHAALASAEVFDPARGAFEATGPLAQARLDHTATALADGRVLVVGGTGPDGKPLASAEVWDPDTGAFAPAGSLGEPRADHTATLLDDGRVLVVGGSIPYAPAVASAEVWDPATGTFAPAGTLAEARGDHTATLLADGRVLIIGGGIPDSAALSSAETWDPASETFEPATPLTDPRMGHTATLLPDGRVLVVGGYGGLGTYSSTAEIRDPSDGTFGYAGSLADARGYHSATLLRDGRVLVAGGYDHEWLATSETWDPVTATFAPAGSLATGRDLQTAALLPDGRVLVAGGSGNRDLASAELWDPAGQSVAMLALPEVVPVTAGPIDLRPQATSGLPVRLEAEGPCTLLGTRLVLHDPGTCTVTASQDGDDTWHPAAPVSLTFGVVPAVDGHRALVPATALPPTFVAPGTSIDAILDPNRGPAHYYGIWLDAGATLHAARTVPTGSGPRPDEPPAMSITEAPTTWKEDPDLEPWAELDGTGWLAPTAGLYLVRVAHTSDGGSPYRYTLTLDVDAPRPASSLPPEGTPITTEVELGDRVAPAPPGTLVASGAVVHGYLSVDRREGFFALDLGLGDTLVTHAAGDVGLSLAYPSDPMSWYPLESPWLASEAGTYTIRVSAFPLSGGLPFSVSFEVDG